MAIVAAANPAPYLSTSFRHLYCRNGGSSGFSSRSRGGAALGRFRLAAITSRAEASYDPDLRDVLEVASESELYDLESILFGPSYFSPMLKSVTKRDDAGYYLCLENPEEREEFIHLLESRFLFLAADARSTIRGWRPSYRNVLLDVRRKLGIPCSSKLPTEDLEAEIFLHLLQEYSSEQSNDIIPLLSENNGSSGFGPNSWKMQARASLKVVADELKALMLKGGGVLTFAKVYQVLARRLSGKMLTEAANYQIKHEILKKGGQLAAINLESRAAMLVARQGFASAASRYFGFRSFMMLLGPVVWGTLMADVVIQMIGTDYARIVRAIYAFAQIRLTRIYSWGSHKDEVVN